MAPKKDTMTEAKKRTRAATVWLPRKCGQGVLVPGGFILTAAHCIGEWSMDGGMALGDVHLESVETKAGASFLMRVCAVEPVADIAVLAAADSQELSDDADGFDQFCEATQALEVSADDFDVDSPVEVHVFTHRNTWIQSTATRYGFPGEPAGAFVTILSERNVEGGTSGGPVIDTSGRLVGLVSVAGGTKGSSKEGTMPRPHLALPRWIWTLIEAAQVPMRKAGRK